jgi:hypothetical protein
MAEVEAPVGSPVAAESDKSVNTWKSALSRWLADRPDDAIMRWLLRGMVVATVAVVALDYAELSTALEQRSAAPTVFPTAEPLPPSKRTSKSAPDGPKGAPSARLRERMTFELAADGRLLAIGAITPGIAKDFAAEIDKRGSYVKTVVLQSPGGSVQDALEMGRLVRAKGFATEIDAGAYCASSCPLVFAGGVQRVAGKGAAIGVHQVAAYDEAASGGMAGAQRVSAICQKYLRDMGVDLGVWVHAMETPREQLYYFKADELLSLKLATSVADGKPVAKKS